MSTGFLGCMRSYSELPSPELEGLGVSLLSGVLLLAFLCGGGTDIRGRHRRGWGGQRWTVVIREETIGTGVKSIDPGVREGTVVERGTGKQW